jgi:hypothetical protein
MLGAILASSWLVLMISKARTFGKYGLKEKGRPAEPISLES